MFSLVVGMSAWAEEVLVAALLVFAISAKQEKASEAALGVLHSFREWEPSSSSHVI